MVLDQFNLDGKIALVTGCKRGIGKAMALGLAEAGADIIGVSATLPQNGSEVSDEISNLGRKFYAYQCDFSNRKMVKEFLDKVKSKFPQIDILVNNAGTIKREPAAEHSDEFWDEVIEVNLTSQFIITREIGKTMLENGKGKIIFTASLLSYQGGITVPGYTASKGGIKQLVMAFANEWAASGINVNGIAPGYIKTDNTQALQDNELRSKQILDRIPAKRWGETSDFKGPVVFLSSEASNYVNGEILLVDGGWMGR
ncbi:MAG: SDR family NAD(P)-dependent oxidoreductase [Melioribacteraceae bacterium]|nr:SDR family NAD(P)-dependent oxidoreductase [Melioribacteraceae bacterium]MCF8264857.1 SDR family NAD(P)-dependent oxidoreductase [Melioribacteraceae bacterium]